MADKPLFHGTEAIHTSLQRESVSADNGIVSRTLMSTAGTRVILFTFADGQVLSEHSSPRAVMVHVVNGTCNFTVNGKENAMSAGDLLYLPPGAPHSVEAHGAFSMLLTMAKIDSPEKAAP